MGTEVAERNPAEIMEQVIVKGDLSKLTPEQRGQYYMKVCESVGLNPLTKPFEYIQLNGKLTLYALRGCTDQLRSIHKVSVLDMTEAEREGVFIVTAKVQNGEGRTDMAKGAVTITGLKGDALANAMMKAETKAKRRATLSICGLGFLDETEIETIPQARQPQQAQVAPRAKAPEVAPSYDPETGEVTPHFIPIPKADNGDWNWIGWGGTFVASITHARSGDELKRWEALNAETIKKIENEFPKIGERIQANLATVEHNLKSEKAAA